MSRRPAKFADGDITVLSLLAEVVAAALHSATGGTLQMAEAAARGAAHGPAVQAALVEAGRADAGRGKGFGKLGKPQFLC